MTKDEALDLALDALESVLANHNGAPVMPWIEARDAIKQARALDKMAENARALGLDYEPVGWWDSKIGFFEEKHFDQLQPLYTTPPAAAVPDAIGPNDDELPAYAAGWNDCRQAMLEMMK